MLELLLAAAPHAQPPKLIPLSLPLSVRTAFLAFIRRRCFTLLRERRRPNFLVDLRLLIVLTLLSVGLYTSPLAARGRLSAPAGRSSDAQPALRGVHTRPPSAPLPCGRCTGAPFLALRWIRASSCFSTIFPCSTSIRFPSFLSYVHPRLIISSST